MMRLEAIHKRTKLRLDWERQVDDWSPNTFGKVLSVSQKRFRRLDFLYQSSTRTSSGTQRSIARAIMMGDS